MPAEPARSAGECSPADDVELSFPPRAEHLGRVRQAVTEVVAGGDVSDARLDDIRLAVSEACANAVEATTRLGAHDEVVEVRCARLDDRLVVEVRDRAGGFDPDALVPHPPVQSPERLHHERGLGIPLMRSLADEVTFETDDDGTTVRLTWVL
ncbi:MAG: ATP-binding protein [Acidimicrobiales bacterium]